MAATAARRQAGRPRGSRRAEIIEAGLRLFASRGFERTTMADVAAELGIGAPALYYWFPAKESLLFACLEQVMAQLNAALAEALETCPPARDPVAALRALVEAQVRFEIATAETTPLANGFLYGALRTTTHFTPEQTERLRGLQRETVAMYRDVVRSGQRAGRFTPHAEAVLAFAILGMVQYVSSWYRPGRGPLDADATARTHADLALQMVGLKATGAAPLRPSRRHKEGARR